MNKFIIGVLFLSFYLIGNSQTIETIKIGTQTWTKQNLNVTQFRNGDIIPLAKTNKDWKDACASQKPAWCYYKNNAENGVKYGKLYNWYAVNDPRGLAPLGYHIPSDSEWNKLMFNIQEDALMDDFDTLGNTISMMKSTTGWKVENTVSYCSVCILWTEEYRKDHTCNKCKNKNKWKEIVDGNGTDGFGFSVLPGGARYYDGTFGLVGEDAFFWSSTNSSALDASSMHLNYRFYIDCGLGTSKKAMGFSVRIVKD
jgi:uncharacterized protein (TIGR02145 family)